ncbi:N-myristoyl transferase [Ramicandelaber brevisporus]|nr:N-myristoyl transferase [Ramicandelaber brevisporus]
MQSGSLGSGGSSSGSSGDGGGTPKVSGKEHQFWKTQPVLQDTPPNPKQIKEGPKHGPIPDDKLRKEPLDLPPGLKWDIIDLDNEDQLNELHALLLAHYVEDYSAGFRFAYPLEFIKWSTKAPGWRNEWSVCVRADDDSNELLAYINGVPMNLRIHDNVVPMVAINFLCIQKKLRAKRLSPLLIQEITRRVNMQHIWQAVYTSGTLLPTPFTSVLYMHRPLNPLKLVKTGFSRLPPGVSEAFYEKRFMISASVMDKVAGWRAMTAADVPAVRKLLNAFLSSICTVHQKFNTNEEVDHYFVPRNDVIHSYVIEEPGSGGRITDFISFYTLPTQKLDENDNVTDIIKGTYVYYYATHPEPLKIVDERIKRLMNAGGYTMQTEHGVDVMNMLKIMRNDAVGKELLFGNGDGTLNYYLYNYILRGVPSDKCGVLLT